jgi:hypothetical protein
MTEESKLSLVTSDMLHCDPDAVLAKRAHFPGTAALVEELMPYYQHAMNGMKADGGAAAKFAPALSQADYSRLPALLAKEVREHLTSLQSNAFQFEAGADSKRAMEIREVASNLYGMMKMIQQVSQLETMTAGKQGAAGRKDANTRT